MKPIILTTREIRGLLDGTIDTIRREIKNNPCECTSKVVNGVCKITDDKGGFFLLDDYVKARSPFQSGDVLYGRESYFRQDCSEDCSGRSDEDECPFNRVGDSCYGYKAQYAGGRCDSVNWRSPVTMPREAARLFLSVEETAADKAEKWDWVYKVKTISAYEAREREGAR